MESRELRGIVFSRYVQWGLPLFEIVLDINHIETELALEGPFVSYCSRLDICESLLKEAADKRADACPRRGGQQSCTNLGALRQGAV